MRREIRKKTISRNNKKILLSWSSGKDSTWALKALREQNLEVTKLITTFNEENRRVAIHSTREELLLKQAEALNMPIELVGLPENCSNAVYESRML